MKGKKAIIYISITVIAVVGAVLLTVWVKSRCKAKETFEPIGDSHYYAYQVEDVLIDEKDVVIKGWYFALKKIRNTEYEIYNDDKFGVIIYDISGEKEKYNDGSVYQRTGIKANVTIVDRPDINEYFKCEYDYTRCGFEARIKESEIDLTNKKYQVIIKPDEMELRGIQAAYIINGEVKYTNPLDDIELSTYGTDLDEIVDKGTCLVSYPEVHLCVYQYGWKLYWIVDKDFFFESYGNTYIEYQTETTQFDKLPAIRTNAAKYWDDLKMSFENCEITNTMNCGEYRVAVKDLPSEYSITQMSTGYCNFSDWVWRRYFRPDYRLRK